MGCDIHAFVEKQLMDGSWEYERDAPEILEWRDYAFFGWLADVRNYSAIPAVAADRGLPVDVSEIVKENYGDWCGDAHSASFITADDLAKIDFDQVIEDRRRGGETCEPGEGKMETLRDFLGQQRVTALLELYDVNVKRRFVFWFDN